MIQRRRRIAAGGLLAVVMLTLFVSTIRVSAIPDNVKIAGVDVSGMDYETARAALAPKIDATLGKIVHFRSTDDPDLLIELPANTLSSGPDFEEAFEAARSSRGRFARLMSRFGIAGQKDIVLHYHLLPSAVATVSDRAEANLGAQPVSAEVVMAGRQIQVREGHEGRSVDRVLLADRLQMLGDTIDVPVQVIAPQVTTATAQAAADRAESMRSKGREVTFKDRSAILAAGVITKALTFTTRGPDIVVGLKAEPLRAALSKALGIKERAPENAKWRLRGEKAQLIAAKMGNRLDTDALAAAIRANPAIDVVAARVIQQKPKRTTDAARKLKITERISSFTTPYDCCQNRVVNIGRAAQILDSTIIMPGERFSLNDALGERTLARGFMEAPSIEGGEIKPTVGGGVSQVATTMYNAAFFGGLEIISNTPHSFYFPRYPMGREATISWQTPDLVFRNNWDAAILLSVATGQNAITITMYSSKLGRRVETTTGERTNVIKPKTIERYKPELEPGTENTIQGKGEPGFSISYTRRVYKGDELISDRTFYWTYKPENEIIEKGPPKPDEPTTSTSTSTTPTGTTTGTGTGTGTTGTGTGTGTTKTP